jgi:endonuclease YncB( thermonuclease family)
MMRVFIFIMAACIMLPARAEQVCSVHDGDTFKLCNGQSIRIWGIDAPELSQPIGKQSRDYLKRLVNGREVDLECTGKSFNRLVCLAAVRVDNGSLSIQREMVGLGLAYDSPQYSKGRFSESENFAKSLSRGVWALPSGGIRPWDWRKGRKKPLSGKAIE